MSNLTLSSGLAWFKPIGLNQGRRLGGRGRGGQLLSFCDRFDLNADMYETLRVLDPSAVEFLNASIVGKFADSYPNFFDESELETLEHQVVVETARRSQEDGVGRNLNDLVTDLNKLPVAFDQLLKALKIALALGLPVSTASNERFFSVLKCVKKT